MSNAITVFDELMAVVRERLVRERGTATIDALEVRRTLNEISAEMRAGKSFEEALAIAALPVDGLGPEEPPVGTGLLPRSASKARPVLVSATVSDEDRRARERALFEERRRRAEAARPAPKPMPPKAPLPVVAPQTLAGLGSAVLELLKQGPRSAYDLAFRLVDDPSPAEVGAALMVLRARRLVERFGAGKRAIWRLAAKGASS